MQRGFDMTTVYAVEQELKDSNIDYHSNDLLNHIRQHYRAYCPKCGSTLDYANVSNDDYLGACLECDEDFYSIECYLEKE
jgi:hypothetical protein